MIRNRNTIIAIQLLPLLESEPRGWEGGNNSPIVERLSARIERFC